MSGGHDKTDVVSVLVSIGPVIGPVEAGRFRHQVPARTADRALYRALEIDPTFRTAIEGRALAYDRLGEHDRAIEEFLRYRALTPGGVGGLGTGAYLFARAGRTEEALGYLAELEELERTSPELALHFDFISALIALGRIDQAVERLERAIEARNSYVVFVRHNLF